MMSEVGGRRVLVVEDEPEIMNLLRELLMRNDYEIIEARHGAEALVQLTGSEQYIPDAVILDINLPLEGGIGVLRFLRETLRSTTPVIVLTASATEEQEHEIERLGVSAYLRKPASSEVILSELSRLIGPGSS